jgi:hypothetical protein
MNKGANQIPFEHRHSAHCETGVVSGLLRKYGNLQLSEPMVFGLASGICFTYLPFIKLNGMPLISYRMHPHAIIRGIQHRLGVHFMTKTYNDQQLAMDDLKRHIDAGRIVGLQTSAYWLPYFPTEMRFQFNMHNIIVYGYDNDTFLISDPVCEFPVTISSQDLQNARFAKGTLAPKGYCYYPDKIPGEFDMKRLLVKSLRLSVHIMKHSPIPLFGIKAITMTANAIKKAAQHKSERYLKNLLAHIIRMQEEIGTGGGGFRFMYAAFLQEATPILGIKELESISAKVTKSGDQWRTFASLCGRAVKQKEGDVDISPILEELGNCFRCEDEAFSDLWRIVKDKR